MFNFFCSVHSHHKIAISNLFISISILKLWKWLQRFLLEYKKKSKGIEHFLHRPTKINFSKRISICEITNSRCQRINYLSIKILQHTKIESKRMLHNDLSSPFWWGFNEKPYIIEYFQLENVRIEKTQFYRVNCKKNVERNFSNEAPVFPVSFSYFSSSACFSICLWHCYWNIWITCKNKQNGTWNFKRKKYQIKIETSRIQIFASFCSCSFHDKSALWQSEEREKIMSLKKC